MPVGNFFPSLGVERHRVVQYAVHVEQDRFWLQLLDPVLRQELLYGAVYR